MSFNAAVLRFPLAFALLISGPSALAQGPVENDNQYAEPVDELVEEFEPIEADPDGRYPMRVRGAFGKGLQFRAVDDNFSVEMRARAQVQGNTVIPTAEDASASANALIRRLRLVIGGQVFRREVTYYLQLGFAPRDLESDLLIPVRDAFVTWHASRVLNIRLGQMKVPFDRQRVTSSSAQQMVDRSSVTAELNLDRDLGLQIYSTDLLDDDGVLSYQLGVFGGNGRNRLSREPGFLATARLQVAPFGRFDDFVESDLQRSPQPKLALAAAVGYNHRTYRTQSTIGDVLEDESLNYAHLAADVLFKFRGFSFLAQWMFRQNTERVGVDGSPAPAVSGARDAMGFFGQGGYLFYENVEVSARVGHIEPTTEHRGDGLQRLTEIGGGLSWFAIAHDLKVQADYFVFLDGEAATPRHQLRLQTQVYF